MLEAIAELGYEPDARAQSLRRGHTKTVGVIIPVIQNPFFWQILSGISSELTPAGYNVYLSIHPEERARALQELVQQRVDGFILLASVKRLSAELTDYLRQSGRPTVEITGTEAEFDHVVHSYASGTRALMMHLFEMGHRHIGFIYGVSNEVQGLGSPAQLSPGASRSRNVRPQPLRGPLRRHDGRRLSGRPTNC